MLKRTAAFVLAWLTAFVLASIANTQIVLGYLVDLGRDIGLGERLSYLWHDVVGLFPAYGGLLFVTLLIAFGVAALIVRKFPDLRLVGFVLAGFVGILGLHLIMQAVFGMVPIWSTLTWFGLSMHALAGAAGGYLYVRVSGPATA